MIFSCRIFFERSFHPNNYGAFFPLLISPPFSKRNHRTLKLGVQCLTLQEPWNSGLSTIVRWVRVPTPHPPPLCPAQLSGNRRSVLLYWEQFSAPLPLGNLWPCLETVWAITTGRGSSWHVVGGGWQYCSTPPSMRDGPPPWWPSPECQECQCWQNLQDRFSEIHFPNMLYDSIETKCLEQANPQR